MMSVKKSRLHLNSISLQPTDTILLTSDNVHIPTQHLLLAAASPYLASLLAQAGAGQGSNTTLSLPFTSKVVRKVISYLGEQGNKGNNLETEEIIAAQELGMVVNKEDVTNENNEILNVRDKILDFDFEGHDDVKGEIEKDRRKIFNF